MYIGMWLFLIATLFLILSSFIKPFMRFMEGLTPDGNIINEYYQMLLDDKDDAPETVGEMFGLSFMIIIVYIIMLMITAIAALAWPLSVLIFLIFLIIRFKYRKKLK